MYIVFMLMLCALLCLFFFFFLMIRRPPRSTLDRSSAASDVYKRQVSNNAITPFAWVLVWVEIPSNPDPGLKRDNAPKPVSYTHLRAHETVLDLVCRLLLEKKNKHHTNVNIHTTNSQDTTHQAQ